MNVRKIAVAMVVMFGFAGAIFASDWADDNGSCYQKGSKQLTIGFNAWAPGPNVGFDIGFHEAISGGAALGFNWWGLGYWSHYRIPVIVRAAFHPFNLAVLADKINIREKLDVYAGLYTGWDISWSSWNGSGIQPAATAFGGFMVRERIGATWFFSPDFYANLEEGGGLGWVNAGIGWKF